LCVNVIKETVGMKLIIGIVILIVIVFVFVKSKNSNNSTTLQSSKKPTKFYSLDDGNQNEVIISAETTKEWFDSTKSKYDWNDFDEYDNLLWEYMYELFDKPVEKQNDIDYWTLWQKFTREQKVFWAFLAFSGDTDNGGINQFIYNKPEFTLVVSEIWTELELEKIGSDYDFFLKELSGKLGDLNEIRNALISESWIWENKVSPFANEKISLMSAKNIEEYFYDKDFRKEVYKKVADYIDQNIDKFTTI
jgi:hypothetical protein